MLEKVVRIRAPPACGKTCIAEEVEQRYAFFFKHTYSIDLVTYRDPSTAQDQIFKDHAILLALWELAQKQETTLIIIDEAQVLNCIDENHSFWGDLKGLVGNPSFNKSLYILMFGIYGEGPSPIRAYNRILSSPISVPTLDFPTVHLDDEEFNVMVSRYNDRTMGIKLTRSCREYIRSILGGHIGLVTHLLNYLDQNFDSRNLRKALGQTPADEIQSLIFIAQRGLKQLFNVRSTPRLDFFAASEVPYVLEVMQELVLNGGSLDKSLLMLRPQYHEAIACLLTSFCITSNEADWAFPSPFIQYALLKNWRDPAEELPDFHEFIQQCIQSLDYAELGESRFSSLAGLVHEDPFKCALYAKMPSYLPREQWVDPEVGRFFGSTGGVDLWIWPANWAIELSHNYNAVGAHVDRFSTTDSHLPITNHIVLNFVEEQDPTLQHLTIRELTRQQEQDQENVWHIHWSPRARHIVLRRNTNPRQELPILEKPLAIKPVVV
ncbi:hypothetical protein C0992_009405 [Termitomyces sp. T32_za158]|nr:hypothetical protein C0992_009405 [Termitomyces sp. T32_za158]